MKKILFFVLLLTLALTACEKESTPTPAGPVTAQIENPHNGDSLIVNIAVTIKISATSYTGIDEFQLWIDGVQVLSTVPQITGSGYKGLTVFYEEFLWTPSQTGTYTIKFVAIEGSGLGMDEVEIEVNVAHPFNDEDGDSPPSFAPTSTKERKQPTDTPPRAVPPPTSTPSRIILPTQTPTPGRG